MAIALPGHENSQMEALLAGLPSVQPLFHRADAQTTRSAQFVNSPFSSHARDFDRSCPCHHPYQGEGTIESDKGEISYHNPLGLEIRHTKTAGRGVFAPGDISAGTILEESPVLILTQAEWERGELNDGVLGGYAFNWSNGGMAVGLGIGWSIDTG